MIEINTVIFADTAPRDEAIEAAKSFIEFNVLTESDVKIAARSDIVCVITKRDGVHTKKGFLEWHTSRQK